MVTTIDLSATELRPDSVVGLIREHAANPGSKQILFKVSHEVLSRFRAGQPPGVNVSSQEANEINQFAGLSATLNEYSVSQSHACTKCGRNLTFYDVFQSGRKQHGDEYIRGMIAGGGYHIQVHRRDSKLKVECTQCGTVNVLDDGCYKCSGYTYA